MTVRFFPAFTLTGSNVISASLSEYNGGGTIQILTGSYFLCFSGTVGGRSYDSLVHAIAHQLTSASANSAGRAYTVRYGDEENRILIDYANAGTQLVTITARNEFTEAIFGMTGSALHRGPSYQISGNVQPTHVWASTYPQLSEPTTEHFEGEDTFVDAVADDGTAYSIGRTGTPVHRDWTITLEPKENIISGLRASNNGAWAFEDLLKFTRSVVPWALVTGSNNGTVSGSDVIAAYRLRAEGARFQPQRHMANLDLYWDHEVMTRKVSASIG